MIVGATLILGGVAEAAETPSLDVTGAYHASSSVKKCLVIAHPGASEVEVYFKGGQLLTTGFTPAPSFAKRHLGKWSATYFYPRAQDQGRTDKRSWGQGNFEGLHGAKQSGSGTLSLSRDGLSGQIDATLVRLDDHRGRIVPGPAIHITAHWRCTKANSTINH